MRLERRSGCTLLVGLGAFDDRLDEVFLLAPCLIVAPPQRSLVFAIEAKVSAGFALSPAFVALLPPKSARKAA